MPEPSPPAAPRIRIPFFPPAGEEPRSRAGCMRWGLIGCAGASVLLIVGLLFLMYKAPEVMDWAFEKTGEQIVAACTPEVTPAEKVEFRARLKTFSESARSGKVKPEDVRAWQATVMGPLADGKITPQEIRGLSSWLQAHTPPSAMRGTK